MGPVGTGDWGHGLGLDNIIHDIPTSLNTPLYDFPPLLCWVLPDLAHNKGIPCLTDLSANIKAVKVFKAVITFKAFKANHKHNFLQNARMMHKLPVLSA